MTREDVYKLIDGEREYQNKRWNESTTVSKNIHPNPEDWLCYIQDYLTEAIHIISREARQDANPKVMAIIRKITAMGVAAMEVIPTPKR